ncbi:hypothetical protein G7054_g10825 [Neopestalotiopsis clavispora]|nr:hypothetical protein G7054_g10825 [Neopestalotiopsis clavispora]
MQFRYLYMLQSSILVAASLPTVDLGYEVHQALSFNETSQLYKFSNIRYAEAPIGDLRWALPVAPTGVDTQIQNGSIGRICPQGMSKWFYISSLLQSSFASNTTSSFDYITAKAKIDAVYPNGTGAAYSSKVSTTDDCLFLDVIVPEGIFNNASSQAPVLVCAGDPSGLIAASQSNGSPGFVYVSMNYRLGGLGFMAGDSYESEGGIANLGLHDQRLALEWVQSNIHLFGGDPSRVTVAGGSAGAGSIISHLISTSDDQSLPFQQAWVESPGLLPATSATKELGATKFLEALGVSTFAEARQLSSAEIIRANADVISASKNSTFQYAPVDDGSYLPTTAAKALSAGNVNPGINLLISHTENEGYAFAPAFANTDELFSEYLRNSFPEISNCTISRIVNDLFPLSNYDGKWWERVTDFVGDYGLKCYTSALSRAYGNLTHNYDWQLFPAFHGYDFLHAFYAGNQHDGLVDTTTAGALQHYISNFVVNGDPNAQGLVSWSTEGADSQLLAFTTTGPVQETDGTADSNCLWLMSHELLL